MNKDKYRFNRLLNYIVDKYRNEVVVESCKVSETTSILKVSKKQFNDICLMVEATFPEICAIEKMCMLIDYPKKVQTFCLDEMSAYFTALYNEKGKYILIDFRYIYEEV